MGGGAEIVSVSLAGIDATVLEGQTQFRIPVTAGRSLEATSGDARMVADTGAIVVKTDAWSYLEEGVITSVSPQAGAVGTIVTIDGERLLLGGQSLTTVTLTGVTGVIVSQTNSRVTINASPCASTDCPAQGDIVLTSETGATVVYENGWKYSRIDSVTPSFGQLGTRITIAGQGLQLDGSSVSGVKLAGIEVEKIVSESDTQVVVIAGESSGSTGVLGVEITCDIGSSMAKAQSWSYLAPSLIETVSPASGQIGTKVTIAGARFFGGGSQIVSVQMGQKLATFDSVDSEDNIVVVIKDDAAPSASATAIVITADTGARTVLEEGWLQLARGEISDTSLDEGQIGTELRIFGDRLRGGGDNVVSVTLAGVAAEIESENDTEVDVIVASATPRQGDIVLTSNTGARVVLTNGFAFLEQGAIDSVTPAQGQLGTHVTIAGTGLRGGGENIVSITLAGEEASITSEDDDEAVVVATEAAAKDGPVVLTAETGATVTLDDGWTFLEPGQIDAATPKSGTRGTRVVLTGLRQLGGGASVESVTLVGIEAEIVDYADDEINIVVSPGTAGVGNIVITADSGATIVAKDAFEYLQYGSVDDNPSPAAGQTGTRVTVCGTDLLGGGEHFEAALLGTCETNILSQEGDCITIEI